MPFRCRPVYLVLFLSTSQFPINPQPRRLSLSTFYGTDPKLTSQQTDRDPQLSSPHQPPSRPHSRQYVQQPIYPQAKVSTPNTLMIPDTFHSHSRPSTPSSNMIDRSGMKRQASLPTEYLAASNLTIQISPVEASSPAYGTNENSPNSINQSARSGTWPLKVEQQLSAPRTTRDRSVSQPQQGHYLNVRTQQKLKRQSMTNMSTSPTDIQTPYAASPEVDRYYPYTTTEYDYPYALPFRC
jgi:hypothetical protein